MIALKHSQACQHPCAAQLTQVESVELLLREAARLGVRYAHVVRIGNHPSAGCSSEVLSRWIAGCSLMSSSQRSVPVALAAAAKASAAGRRRGYPPSRSHRSKSTKGCRDPEPPLGMGCLLMLVSGPAPTECNRCDAQEVQCAEQVGHRLLETAQGSLYHDISDSAAAARCVQACSGCLGPKPMLTLEVMQHADMNGSRIPKQPLC